MLPFRFPIVSVLATLLAASIAASRSGLAQETSPLSVCATVPDLGDIAKAIGGDTVEVEVLGKGPEDPHLIEPRPSFVRTLHDCDVLIETGLDLESAWLGSLVRTARNPRLATGSDGFVDASRAVRPLVTSEARDRTAGDIHPAGNPHYLLDPLNGARVATLLSERFQALRPLAKEEFVERLAAFHTKLAQNLFGEELVAAHSAADLPKLFELVERGGLDALDRYLAQIGKSKALGGWLGELAPYRGAKIVSDHDLWPYFTRRFGLEVIVHLEPKPGLTPNTRHLGEVVRRLRTEKASAILSSPYFDERHAEFVSNHSGSVPIVRMAHQSGARPGADGYLGMLEYNVDAMARALGAAPAKEK